MRKHSVPNWPLLLLVILCWAVFGWLAREVHSGYVFTVDDWAFAHTYSWRGKCVSGLMQAITFLGSSFFLLPANVIVVLWLFVKKRDRIMAFFWSVTAIISLLFMYFFKSMFARPRPIDPYLVTATGFSFPSGHTLNGLTFLGLWIFYCWVRFPAGVFRPIFTFFCIVLFFGIGISRIYFRVHYASDVLGGMSLGIGWLALMIWVFYYYQRRMEIA